MDKIEKTRDDAGSPTGNTVGSVAADGEPRMRADARRSRAKLLEAATAAFADNGADAPLEDIARRAGVGIGTLYRHFPTRVDLQAAVYRSQVETVCAAAEQYSTSNTPEQALRGWLRAMVAYLTTKRGLSRALVDSLGRDSQLITSCWSAMSSATERLLTEAQEAGQLRDDIKPTDVLRLVHAIVIATEQAPEDTERLLGLMLDGFRPQAR
jgi:AcrR family transcriptional regulator